MFMIATLTSSLEDIRNGTFYETREEFARRLGITSQTYRRLIERDPKIENPTKRQIAERLGIPPHLIAELLPAPTPARIAAITAAIDLANATGDWYRLDDDGQVTPAPDIHCPPGDADHA
jgi:transcriptional regulator with XRE-family HTH domain